MTLGKLIKYLQKHDPRRKIVHLCIDADAKNTDDIVLHLQGDIEGDDRW